MKALNLKGIKKTYWQVTLPDDTKLLLKVANKALFDNLAALLDQTDFSPNELYSIVHDILNCNKGGVEVPLEYVEEMDLDDLYAIMDGYMTYLDEVMSTNSKN